VLAYDGGKGMCEVAEEGKDGADNEVESLVNEGERGKRSTRFLNST